MKICIWMNIPSHHQHFFFEALHAREDVELAVRYYDRALLESRQAQGWVAPEPESYAVFAHPESIADPKMEGYVHIIPSFDARGGRVLAELAVRHGLEWCHWGERTGTGFAKMVRYDLSLFKWFYRPLNRIRMRRHIGFIRDHALLALAQGKLAQDELSEWGIPKDRIRILPYAIPALPPEPRSSEIEAFAGGRIVFLCSATLCPGKGIIWLLRAYAALPPEKREKCRLVFVGGGDNSEYLRFCRKEKIAAGVLFAGRRPSDRMAGVYNSCDCFVLPTLHDGWGVVLNEAASAGMPIISTTECGAAWHLIEPGVNGFRVPIKNYVRLRGAMEFYIDHPEKIAEHGRISKKLFESISPRNNAENMVEALKYAMQNK